MRFVDNKRRDNPIFTIREKFEILSFGGQSDAIAFDFLPPRKDLDLEVEMEDKESSSDSSDSEKVEKAKSRDTTLMRNQTPRDSNPSSVKKLEEGSTRASSDTPKDSAEKLPSTSTKEKRKSVNMKVESSSSEGTSDSEISKKKGDSSESSD